MELRILRYFLAVAREGSIIKAAEVLHITQPTLSRQLIELEEELGTKLLNRGNKNRKITLTTEGLLLRKRAEEIIELTDRTELEFKSHSEEIMGDIYIGGGETDSMRVIAKTALNLQKDYPNIHYHLYSGNSDEVFERLDKGLLDFGILIGPANIEKYNYIRLPAADTWGLL
ncbi:MAG: LysR family transcriptional regulator, partial [Fusobacteriaceae bacterium]